MYFKFVFESIIFRIISRILKPAYMRNKTTSKWWYWDAKMNKLPQIVERYKSEKGFTDTHTYQLIPVK